MDNFAEELYVHLKDAVTSQCMAEVFDCGNCLEIEDLATETVLMTINLRGANPEKNRELCKELAKTVNDLVRYPTPELEDLLKDRVERLYELNDVKTIH